MTGVSIATVLAVLLLIAVSFAAGIVARTNIGRRITGWFERSFLGRFPQYQLVARPELQGARRTVKSFPLAAVFWSRGSWIQKLPPGTAIWSMSVACEWPNWHAAPL